MHTHTHTHTRAHTDTHQAHMAPSLLLFLSIIFLTLPAVLPGADAVSTVSNVAVQRGRSVTIPCHYDRKYESNEKYWCQGSLWSGCYIVVRTKFRKVRGETSITDDPTHHVFTVTMAKLKTENSGYYWCAVKIGGHLTVDEGKYLYLSVTAGTPGLWVDQQEVTGVEGGRVSVQCHYNDPSSTKKWCRAEGSCVEVNSAKSGRSEIKDDRSENVFIVTMRELNREDTGWYWCAAGELQIPVHITVTQKPTTTTVTTFWTSSLLTDAITSPSKAHKKYTLIITTEAPSTVQKTSCPEHGSQQRSGAPTSLERTLGPLRHTGVALMFLICSAVAFWKIWRYRRAQHSRENREDVGRYSIKITPM
ncbi:polymeric immunoglobulin receptor-like [Anguilla anguilla]|uniref:polymeric immunoglobulin receptor-like n=1 Tax=Anguilla anguilla TaxID=7936 RepID=UPI0015B2CA77|nr:polymeric immunoglobulin receptor-like [Anguilla anguilla]